MTAADDTLTGAEQMNPNAFWFLLEEEKRCDLQAEEALFLTFNVDLGFLEARLLGVCQASGARVTVVADARVWNPDPRAVKHAGRSYHVGLVDTARAFHPKVMLVVGPERAIAAVGSGNLTMGGWQYNSELLTVFTGTNLEMPTVFGELRDLLASLVISGAVDPLTTSGLRRTLTYLDALLAEATPIETGHRVAASWDVALIDLLPPGPVGELNLSAPFYDDACEAVRRVLQRLQPRHVRLAIQPGWTFVDPVPLERVLSAYGASTGATVEVLLDEDHPASKRPRYRHGKLIEWVDATGERWAMTGSPNLSVVALLKSVVEGGNHEVAVVSPIAGSLFRPAGPVEYADLPPSPAVPDAASEVEDAEQARVPVLSVAERTADGVRLHFSRQLATAVLIETTGIAWQRTSPDVWTVFLELPAGRSVYDLQVDVIGGTRLRVRVPTQDGQIVQGPAVFVTDPQRATRRPGVRTRESRSANTTAVDVTDTIEALRALEEDLFALADEVSRDRMVTSGPTAASGVSGSAARSIEKAEPWLWLQDQTTRFLGPGLAGFALGLPVLPAVIDDAAVLWTDVLNNDTVLGLTADTSENLEADEHSEGGNDSAQAVIAAMTDTSEGAVDHRNDDATLKQTRIRWIRRATQLAPRLSIPARLLILRLTLTFWSAGDWPKASLEPVGFITALLSSLDAPGVTPEEERRMGSLAAVALTMVRQRTDLDVHDETWLAYRRLTDRSAYLLLAAEDGLITEYTRRLRNNYGSDLDPENVRETSDDITTGDRLADLVETLTSAHREHPDGRWEPLYRVTRFSENSLRVDGSMSNPTQVALDAVGRAADAGAVAVWVVAKNGFWTLVAWADPDLITISVNQSGERWRHQRLVGPIHPAGIAEMMRREGGATPYDRVTKPKHQPTDDARAVLAGLGMVTPEPPSSDE